MKKEYVMQSEARVELIEKLRELDSKGIELHYTEEIRKILAHAYRNAPAIRKKYDLVGFHPSSFRSLKDIGRIPVLKKEELRESQRQSPPFGGFLGINPEELQRIYVSPGPIFDPEAIGEKRLMEAKIFKSIGFGRGHRVAVTFSYHMVPAGLLFDKALREVGAVVIPLGTGNTEQQLMLIKELQINGYVGTGNFLMSLVQKATQNRTTFGDFPIKKALLAGESIPETVRKGLEEDFHISTWQGYGTADIGLFAFECDAKKGMHSADEVYIEIVDPATGEICEPGESGEVVVTYFSKAYPLIRFGTGDISYLDTSVCSCGRVSPRLGQIMGRVGDSFKVRGLFLHGSQVHEALRGFSEISKYALVISRTGNKDELTLKVELSSPAADRDRLSSEFVGRIKNHCQLRLDRTEFMEPGSLKYEGKTLIDTRKTD
jgi:phenylacetate-CoA ligase